MDVDGGAPPGSPKAEQWAPSDLDDEDIGSEASTESGCESLDLESQGEPSQSDLPVTFLIFDWDDTLLPLTWLRQQGLLGSQRTQLGEEQRAQLSGAARCVARTLKLAKQLGRVAIVTNAEAGWVEASMQRFMPALAPLLDGMQVTSARTAYQWRAPDAPPEWKRMAFEREIGEFCQRLPDGCWANVVSLGDLHCERDALFEAIEDAPDCWGKALKLLERPSLEQLVRQHGLIQECLAQVVAHNGCLDMSVEGAGGRT